MAEPICRSCYLASLPESTRQVVADQALSMPVYLCPDHQRIWDDIFSKSPLAGACRKIDQPIGDLHFTTIEEQRPWDAEGDKELADMSPHRYSVQHRPSRNDVYGTPRETAVGRNDQGQQHV